MKLHKLLSTSFVAAVLLGGMLQAGADQHRVFGFFGEVDSFDRSSGTMVVEDSLFRISESTQVYKRKGSKGTLSDIRPGVKVGFYPRGAGRSAQASVIDQVWILPRNWRGTPGYAETPDN